MAPPSSMTSSAAGLEVRAMIAFIGLTMKKKIAAADVTKVIRR